VRLLVRTWNLFHGNTQPPARQAFLEEMVRLASADDPDVLCLQELPVWSLALLDDWTGMTAVADVAQPPMLGPFPSTAEIGRRITNINHGLFRSAFAGQANAILVRPELTVIEHRQIALNPRGFRRAQARHLGLSLVAQFAWASERRVCQAVRVRHGEETLLIGNLHATSYPPDKRVPDAELLRAAVFVDGLARPEEPVVLAGDFNISVRFSRTLADLVTPEWGFAGPTPTGIDHIILRGLEAGAPRRWHDARRTRDGRLLSDHAPVEVEIE
jgi:endonuclease/exonuclease/phosphatase family metal-dependent hydrolase